MNWKNWLTGLMWAILTGFGTGITLVLTDPAHFNLETGWRPLVTSMIVFGIFGAGSYLKDSRPKSWKDSIPTVQDLREKI